MPCWTCAQDHVLAGVSVLWHCLSSLLCPVLSQGANVPDVLGAQSAGPARHREWGLELILICPVTSPFHVGPDCALRTESCVALLWLQAPSGPLKGCVRSVFMHRSRGSVVTRPQPDCSPDSWAVAVTRRPCSELPGAPGGELLCFHPTPNPDTGTTV